MSAVRQSCEHFSSVGSERGYGQSGESKSEVRTRQFEVDFLRMMCNFLIVVFHVNLASIIVGNAAAKNVVDWFQNDFAWSVMPVFFFISGFFMLRDFNLSTWWVKLGKRSVRLGVPYVCWNLIFLAIFLGSGPVLKHLWIVYLGKIFGVGTQPGDPPLWYIRCLLVYQFLLPVVWWLLRGMLRMTLTMFSLLFLVVGLSYWCRDFADSLFISFPLYSFPAFFVGGCLSVNKIDFDSFCRKHWLVLTLLGFLCLLPKVGQMSGAFVYVVKALRASFFVGIIFGLPDRALKWLSETTVVRTFIRASFFCYAMHFLVCSGLVRFYRWLSIGALEWNGLFGVAVVLGEAVLVWALCVLFFKFVEGFAPRFAWVLTGAGSRL